MDGKSGQYQHERSPITGQVPSRAKSRLGWQFIFGMLWIALLASVVQAASGSNYWIVFVVILGFALAGGVLALFWAARWAAHDDARVGQFGIATLCLLTMYVAIFLSAVRWLAMATADQHGVTGVAPGVVFAMATLTCLVLLCMSLPFWLGLVDSTMWCAVWLVKRRWMQAIWAKLRKSRCR